MLDRIAQPIDVLGDPERREDLELARRRRPAVAAHGRHRRRPRARAPAGRDRSPRATSAIRSMPRLPSARQTRPGRAAVRRRPRSAPATAASTSAISVGSMAVGPAPRTAAGRGGTPPADRRPGRGPGGVGASSRSVGHPDPQMVIALKPPSTRMIAAGDEARRRVGGQPDGGADQLVRLAQPAGRGVADDRAEPLLGQERAVLLGREEAGRDGVDPDAVRRQLAGQVLGQVVEARLGDRVGEHARERRSGRRRRDVDDRAAAPVRDHRPPEHLAGDEDRGQVHVQQAVPLLERRSRRTGVALFTPGALTRMSTGPSAPRPRAGRARRSPGPWRPPARAIARTPAASRAATRAGAALLRPAEHRDGAPRRRRALADRPTQDAGPTDHGGDAAAEVEHAQSWSSPSPFRSPSPPGRDRPCGDRRRIIGAYRPCGCGVQGSTVGQSTVRCTIRGTGTVTQYVFDPRDVVRYRFPTHTNDLIMDRARPSRRRRSS